MLEKDFGVLGLRSVAGIRIHREPSIGRCWASRKALIGITTMSLLPCTIKVRW